MRFEDDLMARPLALDRVPDLSLLRDLPEEPPEDDRLMGMQSMCAALLADALMAHARAQGVLWNVQPELSVDFTVEGEEGQTRVRRVFPDLTVVVGMPQFDEPAPYRMWAYKYPPNVMFELSVASSMTRDREEKRRLYEQLRIPEYFCFDVEGIELSGWLVGWRLDASGSYVPIPAEKNPGPGTRLRSEQLGLELEPVWVDEHPRLQLQVFLPGSQEPLPSQQGRRLLARWERERAAWAERERELEAERAAWTERERELEAELARLRRQLGGTAPD